jgi:inner membrane protein
MPARFWVLSALCAVVPDADVVAFFFGVAYGDVLGHRGLSHSLVFALLLAFAVVFVFFRGAGFKKSALVVYFFLVTASHGVLDALTDGGLGVAFFAPFDRARYFFPWRPIVVSPIGVGSFFSEWGLAVILSEFVWVWLPSLLLVGVALPARRARRRGAEDNR